MAGTDLTKEEKAQKIKELRERAGQSFPLSPKQKEYCSDVCLDIHLRARKWDMDKAFSILSESLKFVHDHNDLLTHMNCPGCEEDPSQHYFQSLGPDSKGRPVIYTTAACHFPITLRYANEHNIIEFEKAIKSMPHGVETFVYIADLYNIGYANMDIKTNLAFFRAIQAPYRGRMGQVLLVDPPATIWFALKMIKPFLKPETLEKVVFVKTSEFAEVLPPLVGEEMTKKIMAEVEENHDKERASKKKWWKD